MKRFLISSTLLLFLTSTCLMSYGQWNHKPQKGHKPPKNNGPANHILFDESFEDPAVFAGRRSFDKCCAFSVKQSDSVAYKGTHSLRIELNADDRMVSNGKRSELSTTAEKTMNVERWYSFSVFLPKGYQMDKRTEILAQWHETPDKSLGEKWRSPPISLRVDSDKWSLVVLWATNPVNTNETISGRKVIDLGEYDTNKWTTWVFHIKFSYGNDGIMQIWKNGRVVQDYRGPNYYNDKRGPFFKLGIYKWQWIKEHPIRGEVKKRVIFFDAVRIGDEGANYDIMTK